MVGAIVTMPSFSRFMFHLRIFGRSNNLNSLLGVGLLVVMI